MIKKNILFIVIFIDALVLVAQTSAISISYSEATLFYGKSSFLQFLIQSSVNAFGQNDFALRLPMILMHLISIILLYEISKNYIVSKKNRIWLLIFFVLLPGIISAALVVNSAGLIIFGLLLFVYIHEKLTIEVSYLLAFAYLFIDASFVYLFLALSIYYLENKQRYNSLYYTLLFIIAIYLHGIEAYGIPKGHFLDTIGIYSTIFTPMIFVFIFYALYRSFLTNNRDLIWYLASVSLIISLLLSFRQRVSVEHFAPYLIVALPLVAQTFISSYRVRLKIFRKRYRALFFLSFIFLVFNSLVVLFNKELYLVLENPKKHFAYNTQIARNLAKELKSQNINCVQTDKKMMLRLNFYGISNCKEYILKENTTKFTKKDNVTISYRKKILYSATVTKLNNK